MSLPEPHVTELTRGAENDEHLRAYLREARDAATCLIPLAHASHDAFPKTWGLEIKAWLLMIEAKMTELLGERH